MYPTHHPVFHLNKENTEFIGAEGASNLESAKTLAERGWRSIVFINIIKQPMD